MRISPLSVSCCLLCAQVRLLQALGVGMWHLVSMPVAGALRGDMVHFAAGLAGGVLSMVRYMERALEGRGRQREEVGRLRRYCECVQRIYGMCAVLKRCSG